MQENIMNYETVAISKDRNYLVIIDQTKLPEVTEILKLNKQKDIWEAIYKLKVRGAPAIGVAAAIGIYLAAKDIEEKEYEKFNLEFEEAKDYLASSRPTAVNLFWALDRMHEVVLKNEKLDVNQIKELLFLEAKKIKDEDIEVCRKIGEWGLTLLKDGDGVLTHCNAGQLATAKYGTALAPLHLGKEKGMKFKVFTDETRPLLQGARLSAYELHASGIDTTLICDNMASIVMKNGWIQAVFVGCDRVAINGDTANKIGTSGVAILAKYYNIPFYVCAPLSTIDEKCIDGSKIEIEEREEIEITEMWYKERMAPYGVKVYNPAFDVTDNSLITAFITEKGIIKPPFNENLKAILTK